MVLGRRLPWDWHDGLLPSSAVLDDQSMVETSYSFLLDRSEPPFGVRIGRGVSTYGGTMFDVGPRGQVTLGQFCMTNGTRFVCDERITVGSYSLLAWSVVIMDTYRTPLDPLDRRRALEREPPTRPRRFVAESETRPVTIGEAVWIGFESVVLPGVNIGEGVVVGARSVVAGDCEPWTVVAGNPARVIRRFARPDSRAWPTAP
jgi:acetyltransferase-like isoleucine patch superfamily enzyme